MRYLIDWKNERDIALQQGVREENNILFKEPKLYLDIPRDPLMDYDIKNFPDLTIEDTRLLNCTFVDCGQITFENCKLNGCSFRRIEKLYLNETGISESEFVDLKCEEDCVISMEDGIISHSLFKNIELNKEAYLCDAVGDVWVEHCSFENCHTDREDRELFHCEEVIGKLFKRKREFNIVDDETCTGLDTVRAIGGKSMTTPKIGKCLTTVPVCTWGIADKLSGLLERRENTGNTATLDNLQRLQELRKAGVITNEEYETLKARLVEHIR